MTTSQNAQMLASGRKARPEAYKGIEKGANYRAYLVGPANADEIELGPVTPDGNGDWELPLGTPPFKLMPIFQDWVMVLEAV